jgi:hypothetical protein
MRAHAPALDGVSWAAGTFEATGLAARSQRWAVAAQAFHWADPPRALPEIRRVLAPGACFSVLWNVRDPARSELVAWTLAQIERIAPGFDEGYRAVDWGAVLTSTGDFDAPRSLEERHAVRMGPERYLDLWRSHHHLNRTAGPEKVAGLLAEIAARLAREEIAALDVPYLCRAWTARAAEPRA